jgi:hypothetical protein
MLRWGKSNCSFVFVRSFVRSFVHSERDWKVEMEWRGENDAGIKSDDERKKRQRKGLVGEVILIEIFQSPPCLGFRLRMRNASPSRQDFTIGMIQW